jgi:predicted transcriptional regulator
LIKIDYQIETVKNAIEFLKHNTRRTNTQIIEEIAKKYDLSRSDVATLIEEKPKFGI